jgi:uncharacterized membrane protein
MGLVVGLLIKRNGQNFISKIIAMSAGALIMAAGYLIYEYFILQMGVAALANILWNMVQAVAGVIIGTLVVSALGKIKGIQGFVDDLEGK